MRSIYETEECLSARSSATFYAFIFLVALHIAWIGAWILAIQIQSQGLGLASSGSRSLYWLGMKLLFWILPSLMLIRMSGLTLKKLIGLEHKNTIVFWGVGTGLMLGATALAAKAWAQQPLFAPSPGWAFFSGVLIAPIVEEITFRGAVLGAFSSRYSFATANVIASLFFLSIHLPGWYFQGCLWSNLSNPLGGALSILLLGLLFGYVARKSNSVAAATICHSLNNLFNV